MARGVARGDRLRAIGLMSGTSADGVDAALLETDGEGHVHALAFVMRPYADAERALIRNACKRALSFAAPGPHPEIAAAERMLTQAHAEAVKMLPGWQSANVIGFHGQTVAHRPPSSGHAAPFTWQIGDAPLLMRETGLPVVHDFRSDDLLAGGEGAPLAPGYHRARLADFTQPVAILNLGGVGNITWFENPSDTDARWGGFDTGPANALIDDWVQARADIPFDRDGTMAASGQVHEDLVQQMAHQPGGSGARSLDRNDYSADAVQHLSAADGAATLTALTAETVAMALDRLPCRPAQLFVTGGGRHNPALMAMIAQRGHVSVQPVEALGWDGDALEAEAFAWLAVRHLHQLPISWPETTGAPRPLCGGRLVLPDEG